MMPASAQLVREEFVAAGPPPPGVTPNFIDPVDQRPTINGVYSTLIILTLLFLFIRLYTNFVIKRSGGYDSCAFLLILH